MALSALWFSCPHMWFCVCVLINTSSWLHLYMREVSLVYTDRCDGTKCCSMYNKAILNGWNAIWAFLIALFSFVYWLLEHTTSQMVIVLELSVLCYLMDFFLCFIYLFFLSSTLRLLLHPYSLRGDIMYMLGWSRKFPAAYELMTITVAGTEVKSSSQHLYQDSSLSPPAKSLLQTTWLLQPPWGFLQAQLTPPTTSVCCQK